MTKIIRLDKIHLPAVIALHRNVIARTDPTLVAHETDAFFQNHMSDCGQIFGIFDQDALVAYGILGIPRPDDPNFGIDHNLPPHMLAEVAHIDGVAIREDHRGHHWQQKLTLHRLKQGWKSGRKIALTTIAPGNFASLINTLSVGMSIRGLKDKYGGKRFLMRLDLDEALTTITHDKITDWCPATNFTRCHDFLDAGYIGITFRKTTSQSVPEIGWVLRHCM